MEQWAAATENVDVYLDDFISVVQGGPRESCQILQHLFQQTERVFHLNEEGDTNKKYPISLKKLGKGDEAWSTRKTVLGWDLDTIDHLLCLPPTRKEKVAAALAAIPWESKTTSLRKWHNILGLLRSITPSVNGSRGMFTRVQHDLKRAAGRHVQLTTDVHDKLESWHKLVRSLANRPTHLRELEPFYP